MERERISKSQRSDLARRKTPQFLAERRLYRAIGLTKNEINQILTESDNRLREVLLRLDAEHSKGMARLMNIWVGAND